MAKLTKRTLEKRRQRKERRSKRQNLFSRASALRIALVSQLTAAIMVFGRSTQFVSALAEADEVIAELVSEAGLGNPFIDGIDREWRR